MKKLNDADREKAAEIVADFAQFVHAEMRGDVHTAERVQRDLSRHGVIVDLRPREEAAHAS